VAALDLLVISAAKPSLYRDAHCDAVAMRSSALYFPLPPPPELGASRLFCALLGRSVPGVVDVPGVTGSLVLGAGPIAREPDAGGGDVGGAVVWAKEAPEISVTIPVTTTKGLSMDTLHLMSFCS
jgi:hypothetical protein